MAERELEQHAERVEEQRRELPWVPVEKRYGFEKVTTYQARRGRTVPWVRPDVEGCE